MPPTRTGAAPVVDGAGVTFHLADPTRRYSAVRLEQEVGIRAGLDFTRRAGSWRLRVLRPPVDRMEYLLELTEGTDNRDTVTDPGNPLRAPGAFGEKSVVQFPGYREPAWFAMPSVAVATKPLSVRAGVGRTAMTGVLWSPEELAPQEPAPLLVVHDGPEYATLGSLTHFLGALMATGTLPALRAALLAPGERNSCYAADGDYARALCREVIPALDQLAPTTVRIGAGVSLGALAMLHAHYLHPSTFDGLLLQSGSFFTPALDPQETDFSGFGPVTRFVAEIAGSGSGGRPVPTAMTCGGVEENRANNQQMADTLTRRGYRVDYREVRDAHNFTAWRDALDPAFTDLLRSVVGARAA